MRALTGGCSSEVAARERLLGRGRVPRCARVRALSGDHWVVSSLESESGTPPAEEAPVDHRAESTFGRRTWLDAATYASTPHPSLVGANSGMEHCRDLR